MTHPSSDSPLTPQPLFAHLNELRVRLMWCIVALLITTSFSYLYVEDIYGILVRPLADAMGEGGTHRMIYTNPTEAFFTYIKISLFMGAFLSFPLILVQIWRFVAPGLYAHERSGLLPFLVATPLLFFLGGVIVHQIVLPTALRFFLSFQSTAAETVLPIQLEARVSDYLDLVMILIFAFGLSFQLPVVLGLLARAGVLTDVHLVQARRYAIVVVFIVAAILTPPDIVSQISLAIPLMGLYELSIWIVRWIAHGRGTHDG